MAIGKSIVNFFKAVTKHNKHIADKGKMSSQIKRHQTRVDGRRKALDKTNNQLADANNSLNLADANINSFKSRVKGVQNKLGTINNDIQTQMNTITTSRSKNKIRKAQTELLRLNQEQQRYTQDLNNLTKSIKKYKNDRNTARKDVKKYTKAQTQASNKFDSATNNYNKYINDMHNYQDPGLGVRAAARIMRDPASLYKEPLRYGAMYGVPMGAGYLYATGSAKTDNTLNEHYNAPQDTTKITPEDESGAAGLLAGGAMGVQNNTAETPAYIPVRNPSAAYPSYAPAPGTIQDVPEDQWAAFAPPGPLVVGNPTEQYSAFAPGPEHLPDVPQDEWDNYAPPQITSPIKEAMRIQLERERQAQAAKS